MAKSKSKKVNHKERAFALVLNVSGNSLASFGLSKLKSSKFMQPAEDAAPEDKNYKPLMLDGVITVGAGAGAVFIPDNLISSFLMGVTSGAAVHAINDVKNVAGIGAAPKADVQRFLDLYKDLNVNGNRGVKGTAKEINL